MKVSEAISIARKAAGLTQEQLAAKVYVTRQAVSRWENGESAPSIDMRKLVADALSIPVTDLLELPDEPTCQCCGTPFSVPRMPYGTEADGSENTDYCKWCYEDGHFTNEGLDEIIERNVPFLMQATGYTAEEAVSFMGAVMPTLKRWADTTNENKSANVKRSKIYVCTDCGNIAWSMGSTNISCCGNALSPLIAQKAEEGFATKSVVDGSDVIELASPMTKDDYIVFVAAVSDDQVRIKRLYPQQAPMAHFYKQGHCTYYAYRNDGAFFRL